nr:MAG: hypothetical protein EDM05_05890 [Leptolyngbya sp. IPPAS B-1204]
MRSNGSVLQNLINFVCNLSCKLWPQSCKANKFGTDSTGNVKNVQKSPQWSVSPSGDFAVKKFKQAKKFLLLEQLTKSFVYGMMVNRSLKCAPSALRLPRLNL